MISRLLPGFAASVEQSCRRTGLQTAHHSPAPDPQSNLNKSKIFTFSPCGCNAFRCCCSHEACAMPLGTPTRQQTQSRRSVLGDGCSLPHGCHTSTQPRLWEPRVSQLKKDLPCFPRVTEVPPVHPWEVGGSPRSRTGGSHRSWQGNASGLHATRPPQQRGKQIASGDKNDRGLGGPGRFP